MHHEHHTAWTSVHHVFISMCMTPTFKIIALWCNESITLQIHKLNKVWARLFRSSHTKMSSVQIKYGNLLLAFPFFIEIWFDNHFSTWSPSANINVSLALNQSDQLSWRSRNRVSWAIKVLEKSMWRVLHCLSVHDPWSYPPNPHNWERGKPRIDRSFTQSA
jgi:hypothetical protein